MALTLSYFDGKGRAQAVRYAFAIGGIKFEDKRLDFAAFGAARADPNVLPLGSLPTLSLDGKVVASQSRAIRHYAGKLAGLAVADPMEALRCDDAEATSEDLHTCFYTMRFEPSPEKQKQCIEEFFGTGFNYYATYIERILQNSTSEFFASKVAVADLFLYSVYEQIVDFAKEACPDRIEPLLKPFPKTAKLLEAVAKIPAVRDFGK